ncbi:hypothetical protein [Spirillospora sp. CA-294931]|uniref:hypothetical protein n=1 Tax=Spirillospora sp. CA-294931 TaxID=3240042 RepID=UPI003D8E27CD
MRMSATQLVGALAIGGAVLTSAACGPVDAVTGGGDKKAACDNIKSAAEKLSSSAQTTPDINNPGAGLSNTAQKLSDFASTVRSEGAKAGGDVESSATKFAGDIDTAANALRSASSNPAGAAGSMGKINDMKASGEALSKACGFSGGFRIGS